MGRHPAGVSRPDPADGVVVAQQQLVDAQVHVEQVLCHPALRVSPLWAVQELEWTDLGQGWRSALKIRWSDPKRPNERYVFSRHDLAAPTASGVDTEFWWLGVNCATHETRDTVSFGATRSGVVLGLLADTPWVHPPQSAPAANAYVLLCEHP